MRSLSDGEGMYAAAGLLDTGMRPEQRNFCWNLNRLNAETKKHDGLTVLSVRITSKEPASSKVTGLPQLSLPVLIPEEKRRLFITSSIDIFLTGAGRSNSRRHSWSMAKGR